MEQKVKILIALTDSQLAHQISKKLKDHFSNVPFKIDVMDEGRRALNDFRNQMHEILIIGEQLPGLSGPELAHEVTKIAGGVAVFILGHDSKSEESSADWIKLPIVNWTEFLGRIQNAIPEEIKARFGLSQRNSQLFEKLQEYGKKYSGSADSEQMISSRPHVLIPQLFHEEVNTDSVAESIPRVSQDTSKTKLIFKSLTEEQRKKTLKVELTLLSITLLTTVGVYLWHNDGSQDSIFSLKFLMATLSIVSFFGFFVGRALDRFILSKELS